MNENTLKKLYVSTELLDQRTKSEAPKLMNFVQNELRPKFEAKLTAEGASGV
jgi:hypothetical protein